MRIRGKFADSIGKFKCSNMAERFVRINLSGINLIVAGSENIG
jgi:hypothetical protein